MNNVPTSEQYKKAMVVYFLSLKRKLIKLEGLYEMFERPNYVPTYLKVGTPEYNKAVKLYQLALHKLKVHAVRTETLDEIIDGYERKEMGMWRSNWHN